MEASEEVESPDWLAACRTIAARMEAMFADHPTTAQRAVETGRGEGGDEALVIDREAEEIVFDELDALHRAGHRFAAISEERERSPTGRNGPWWSSIRSTGR
jgi:myo-inositol-1(or 4)-monophosphatase